MSKGRTLLLASGCAALALLVIPFFGFVITTSWIHLRPVHGDFESVWVSIWYTLLALLVIVAIGTPLSYWLARSSFYGKAVVEALVLLPLLTPPLAMGILLAMFYGPYSWAGRAAGALGVELTNTPAAFVLAQVYAAAPYFVVAARSAFEAVDPELEQISLTLGKSAWQTFWDVTVPLARLGLVAGIAIAWVRALGEFGIVLIIAYFPQGIPVKLWVNLQDVGLSAVYPLLWLFFMVAMPLPLVLGIASRRYLSRPEAI
jgi:molybdate/tungstate transport system permease protein